MLNYVRWVFKTARDADKMRPMTYIVISGLDRSLPIFMPAGFFLS